MLGRRGALMGTRFYASPEALGEDRAKQRIIGAHGSETARTRIFDIVRDYAWPAPYTGRPLRNRFLARWNGRQDDLFAVPATARPAALPAPDPGAYETAMGSAGESLAVIRRTRCHRPPRVAPVSHPRPAPRRAYAAPHPDRVRSAA